MNKKSYNTAIIQLLVIWIFIIASCKNDIEKVHNLTNEVNLPTKIGRDLEVEYLDSGKLKGRMYAPLAEYYENLKEPYIEFKKGIKVIFFDPKGNTKSIIRANYALYYNNKKLWEARNNVVAKNLKKKEELYSEELIWDEKKDIVYSEKFTKIIDEDGIHYGEKGFEADPNLTYWHLKGSKGEINIKDEQDTTTNK